MRFHDILISSYVLFLVESQMNKAVIAVISKDISVRQTVVECNHLLVTGLVAESQQWAPQGT